MTITRELVRMADKRDQKPPVGNHTHIVPKETRAIAFYLDGVLAIETMAMTFVAPVALTVSLVRLAVDTAPTGADLIIDIHKNGVTIFTTQTNRPKIIAGASSGISVAPNVTAIAAGDKITLEIDQVGSTIAGENLAVSIVCIQS